MTDQAASPGFATLAIHAGEHAGEHPAETAEAGLADRRCGALSSPNEETGNAPAHAAATAVLEERLAALEGGSAALALASGEAAHFLALHLLLQQGDALIAASSRAGARAETAEAYRSFGWEVSFADPAQHETIERALSSRTRAILISSFGDDARVTDIAAIAAIAKAARVPLVVDNTLATPYLLRPIEYGADIIIHSAMKFLGGHEALTGGVIVDAGSFDWSQDGSREPRFPLLSQPQPDAAGFVFAERYGNFALAAAARLLGLAEFGPALSPFNAFPVLSGLETLALRMQRHSDNALRVAEHLAGHPKIAELRYPGLPSDPAHALAQAYCPNGCGAILVFRLAGGYHAARAFVGALKLFSPLEDVGDTRSRACHPASMTHRHLNDVAKSEAGAEPDLIRLSIGLEDIGDIIADLDQALAIA